MTFEELLKECASGKMPQVEIDKPVRGSKLTVGDVVTIKNGDGYHGCAVRFWDLSHNTWFYATDGNDKRCNYMKELRIKTRVTIADLGQGYYQAVMEGPQTPKKTKCLI